MVRVARYQFQRIKMQSVCFVSSKTVCFFCLTINEFNSRNYVIIVNFVAYVKSCFVTIQNFTSQVFFDFFLLK